MQGPDDDVESYDPNEVMAKAYMNKNKPVDEDSPRQTPGPLSKKRPMPGQDGPLAFLGLQKKAKAAKESEEDKTIESPGPESPAEPDDNDEEEVVDKVKPIEEGS